MEFTYRTIRIYLFFWLALTNIISCNAEDVESYFEYKIQVNRNIFPTSSSAEDIQELKALLKAQEGLSLDQKYRAEVVGPISRLKLATEGKVVPIDIIVKFSLKGGLYVQYVYKDSTPNFTLEYYVTPDGLLYEIRQRTREVRLMRFSDNTFSDILVLVPELNDALTLSLSSTAKFANVDSRSLWNAKNEYLNKFFMNGFTAERWNSATDGSTVLIKNPKGELAYRATLLHNEQQNRNALQDGEIWDVRRYANGPKEIMKETWAVGRKNLVNDVFSFSYSIPIGKGYILEDMTSPGGKHYNIDKGD